MKELGGQGQSIWLDYIRRNLIRSGELKRLVDDDGIRGVTSNPTIFEKAIAGSTDYDEALRAMLARAGNAAVEKLYEPLAIENIGMVPDVRFTMPVTATTATSASKCRPIWPMTLKVRSRQPSGCAPRSTAPNLDE